MKTQEKKAEKIVQAKQSEGLSVRQAPAGEVLQAYREGQLHREAVTSVASFCGYGASNRTGMPDRLKASMEHLSGYNLDQVRVHYNSDKPAQLQSLAYTQGTDIHIAPGQEQHLPHEAWHVVQQMQGRVQPTCQLKGMQVNDDSVLEKEADQYGRMSLADVGSMAADTAPAQLRSGTGKPVAQMFRLVRPEAYSPSVPGASFFSTHKVVHIQNNQDAEDLFYGVNTAIASDVVAKLEQSKSCMDICQETIGELEGITSIQQPRIAGLNIINRTSLRLKDKIDAINDGVSLLEGIPNRIGSIQHYFNALSICINEALAGSEPHYNLVLQSVGDIKNAYKGLLKASFIAYFNTSGRMSDPQHPNSTLGAERYEVTGNGNNTLGNNSRFEVHCFSSNEHFPMLVSDNTQFAINATYPEPKEVYMTDDAMGHANQILHYQPGAKQQCALFSGNASVRIAGTVLKKYIPRFSSQPLSSVSPVYDQYSPQTNACDAMVRTHYPERILDNLMARSLKLGNSRVPWAEHYAGKLCIDGSDTLSLENGARSTWVSNRGNIRNYGAGNFFAQNGDFQREMNKTWYFRIYGPKELGQDITQQTMSRFGQ